jgi:hypothetical protein
MNRSNKNILKVLEYVRKLLFLADKGDMQRKDDGCGVLYGIVRDSAYKMKEQAEKEIDTHKRLGKWDEQLAPEKEEYNSITK